MVMKRIQWEKPSNSWMKLNTDRSSLGNPGVDGGGGLIRDENGNWVVGLARRIGIANSFMAELCALCDGLLLCLQFNIQAIIIKLDARAIVDAFNHQSNSNTIIFSIMDDCRQLVTQIPQLSFRHVFREANRSVDCLASLGPNLESEFVLFSSPPVDLISILEADCRGMYFNRPCPEPVFAL